MIAILIFYLQSLGNCDATSSANGPGCTTETAPAQPRLPETSPWLVAAAVAATCSILSASFRERLDAAVDSFLGPIDRDHYALRERIASRVRLVPLFVMPLNAAYLFYVAKLEYPVMPVLMFLLFLMTPASLSRLKQLLKFACFILLPLRIGLVPYLHPAASAPPLGLIPASLMIPVLAALLHASVAEQLSVTLFANAIVFSCAHTQLEYTVSALASCITIAFTLAQRAWLQRPERRPAASHSKFAMLIATTIVAAEFCIAFGSSYFDEIWQFASQMESLLLSAAAGMALLGSLLCLWTCQHQAASATDSTTQLGAYHERMASTIRLATLCVLSLNGAYQFYVVSNPYPVMPVMAILLLLMAPVSITWLKQLFKFTIFILLPFRVGLIPYLHPTASLPPLGLIPASFGVPLFGAWLHVSVAEQLSVALFVNATVLYYTRDLAVCTLSIAMTVISSVAVVVKVSTLCASFEASRAKAETAKRQQCEMEVTADRCTVLIECCLAALGVVNHAGKRTMINIASWLEKLSEHALGEEVSQILQQISLENNKGIKMCTKFARRRELQAAIYSHNPTPSDLPEVLTRLAKRMNVSIGAVHEDFPRLLMVDEDLVELMFENVTHNARQHGEQDGEVHITLRVDFETVFSTVTNKPGRSHDRNLALQAERGENSMIRDCASNVQYRNQIGCNDSTFLRGLVEVDQAAQAMGACAKLSFLQDSVEFSLAMPMVLPDNELPPAALLENKPQHTESPESELTPAEISENQPVASGLPSGLPDGTVLVCADDDRISRMMLGHMMCLQGLNADQTKSIVLGETLEEAQSLVQTVMHIAAQIGERNVICIFDQMMEYGSTTVLGTNVTTELRNLGFKGTVLIRSANDDHIAREDYRTAGASGFMSKSVRKGPEIVESIVTQFHGTPHRDKMEYSL